MTKQKHPGGRPTVATPDNIEKAEKYLEGGWKIVPTVEGMALALGISKESLYARDEFSDVMMRLKAMQGDLLINGGLGNHFNPTISKLLLSSKHGYVEKQATDITTKGESINPYDPALADRFSSFLKQETQDQ